MFGRLTDADTLERGASQRVAIILRRPEHLIDPPMSASPQHPDSDVSGRRGPPSHGIVQIGSRRFDFGTLAFDDGQRLSPKASHVLWLLVREAGHTVSKDALLDAVWAGQFRVPDVLVQAVGEIRRGLGDSGRDGTVRTIPKLGYRLQQDVLWLEGGAPKSVLPPATAQRPRTRRSALGLAALAMVLLFLGVAWWQAMRPTPPGTPGTSYTSTPALRIDDLQRVVAESGADIHPAPHPDGGALAYARKNSRGWYRIHLRPLDGSPAQVLHSEHEGDDVRPTWSRDGTRIAFQRFRPGNCHYVLHEIADARQREVGGCFADLSTALTFSVDGEALLITDRVASRQPHLHLVRLDLETGAMRLLDYARESEFVDHSPRFSPDGRELAFLRLGARGAELMLRGEGAFDVERVAAFGGDIAGFDWLDDGTGWLVSALEEAEPELWQVNRSGASVRVVGPPLQRLARSTRSGLWVAEHARVGATIHALASDGSQRAVTRGSAQDLHPTPGPGGQLLFVSTRSGHPELWLQEQLGGPARQLTSRRGGRFGRPHWEGPDAIRFTQVVDGRWGAWRLVLGEDNPKPLVAGPYELTELVQVGEQLFAIGVPPGGSGTELLTLGSDGGDWRVDSTGIAAIDARGGVGSLWLRQALRRGIREVNPQSLEFTGREFGNHHFPDWLVEEQGVLHWAAVDAVRSELHFIPFNGDPVRVVLPGDDSYSCCGGLARAADGTLLFSRLQLDEVDIVSFRLSSEDR